MGKKVMMQFVCRQNVIDKHDCDTCPEHPKRGDDCDLSPTFFVENNS